MNDALPRIRQQFAGAQPYQLEMLGQYFPLVARQRIQQIVDMQIRSMRDHFRTPCLTPIKGRNAMRCRRIPYADKESRHTGPILRWLHAPAFLALFPGFSIPGP
jgi:hypothetical protein